jgi:hypothetical protein
MIIFLDNSILRAKGVLGLRDKHIRGKAFAFVYPFAFARKFFTWFCPTLRILAFSDVDGSVIFDKAISPHRFVDIPATRLVIELHPDDNLLAQTLKDEIAKEGIGAWMGRHDCGYGIRSRAVGATMVDDPFRDLLFALLQSAVGELRALLGATLPEKIATFDDFLQWRSRGVDAYHRGLLLSSAAFLMDVRDQTSVELPPTAVRLADFILKAECTNADEILAASVAGTPWMPPHQIGECFRCKVTKGTFRQVIVDQSIPAESAWRLLRPENHVCLCQNCAKVMRYSMGDKTYLAAAYIYWGVRFRALQRWYQAYSSGNLPADWRKENYPLWPREYAGNTWESGSGALEHCAPVLDDPDPIPEMAGVEMKSNKPKMQFQQLQQVLV